MGAGSPQQSSNHEDVEGLLLKHKTQKDLSLKLLQQNLCTIPLVTVTVTVTVTVLSHVASASDPSPRVTLQR